MPLAATKSKIAILRIKVTIKITRSLTLVSFERVSSLECILVIVDFHFINSNIQITMYYYRLGESCSHIGALLFKLEAAVRLGYTSSTCTDVPCAWNQCFVRKVNPAIVCDIKFYKESAKQKLRDSKKRKTTAHQWLGRTKGLMGQWPHSFRYQWDIFCCNGTFKLFHGTF